MKRNFTALNQVDHMPLYNRSHGQSKSKGDIALSTHKKQQVFLEKEIKSDDTLQSVALEFNVPVAELKRINNIHKDNEIYARKIIKVPSNPLSLLLEKEYFNSNTNPVNSQPVPETCDVIVESVNNSSCTRKSSIESLKDEQEPPLYVPSQSNEDQESVSLLTTTVQHKTKDVMSCNGADWGISWHVLILVTLVVGVGGPVLYVFWFLWGRKGKTEGS